MYKTLLALSLMIFCGHSVSAEDVHLYFIGGQSNSTGKGLAADLPEASVYASPQTDVKLWYRVTRSVTGTLAEDQIIDLQPGSGFGGSGVEFGPELSIGRTLADAFTSQNVLLVKGGRGGSNLASDWASDGDDYDTFLDIANGAIDAVVANGDTPVLMGMFWVQGEADAQYTAAANTYGTNLAGLIERVRDDLFDGEQAPFVFSQLSDNQYSSLGTNELAVRTGQIAVSQNTDNTSLILTDDAAFSTYDNDLIHYDADGQINLGLAMGNAMVTLVPEPSSLALLGLGGLALIRRRRD